MTTAYEDLLARAEADPDVLGIVLTGSQARAGMATAHSDADVIVVVAEYGGAWTATTHSLADLADTSDRLREELDGYVNFVYRAAKNRRDGQAVIRPDGSLPHSPTPSVRSGRTVPPGAVRC